MNPATSSRWTSKTFLAGRCARGAEELRTAANQLASIPEGDARVLLATGRYIGEGFDDARLDTLFLTPPVSWRGTVAQYVGTNRALAFTQGRFRGRVHPRL
jgi:hypothetical protein